MQSIAAFFRGQKTCVTGASGFVGWHVAQQLIEAGAKVQALIRPGSCRDIPGGMENFAWIEGDLRRRDSLNQALRGCRYLFHVAGDYRFWTKDPRELFSNNVDGTANILEAARKHGIEKIVYTSTVGILQKNPSGQLAEERRLACEADLKGPYKRSKFQAYLTVKARTDAGWPIVTALPTAPIGPRDLKPTPTGAIIVRLLNGGIPMLARTGLNFVDVRQCARGHLLALMHGEIGERYLLGGINLWLAEFFQMLQPYTPHSIPRHYSPHWLSYLAACVSELAAARWTGKEPFVTRESVGMSIGPHFSTSAKAERELGYISSPIDNAVRDAVEYFHMRGLAPAARIDRFRRIEPDRIQVR
ncbi:MAG: NAD-dependent epimerase/dehydratase [Chthoniobacteraceae bacterium]|nr:NAD-dependent epimerase/dehydratase [Chthoniobacteraceae bacterium]